eukprot:SAG11_NODE_26198_length_348_cov_1.232932_1_plen_35_part_10
MHRGRVLSTSRAATQLSQLNQHFFLKKKLVHVQKK